MMVLRVQGPPGTGKTSTVSALVQLWALLRRRVLSVAPSNAGVATTALRVLRHLRAAKSHGVDPRQVCLVAQEARAGTV